MNPGRGRGKRAPERDPTAIAPSPDRGVFMISVAAELAEMHPQTLRIYEARGLITPKRSPKGTRLYSQTDVEKLRRIQEMTVDLGMNLAGVEKVLELESTMESMARRLRTIESQAEQLRKELETKVEEVRREFRAEVVVYEQPGTALVQTPRGLRRVNVVPPEDRGRG